MTQRRALRHAAHLIGGFLPWGGLAGKKKLLAPKREEPGETCSAHQRAAGLRGKSAADPHRPWSVFFDEGFFAFFLDGRQGDQHDQRRGQDQQG